MPLKPLNRRSYKSTTSNSKTVWDKLPWKKISTSDNNNEVATSLESDSNNEYEDSMFYELETIDASSYVIKKHDNEIDVVPVEIIKDAQQDNNNLIIVNDQSDNKLILKDTKKKTNKKKDKKKSLSLDNNHHSHQIFPPQPDYNYLQQVVKWDSTNIELSILLHEALLNLNFVNPTPIQIASIPLATIGR